VDNPQEVDPRTLESIRRFKEAHGFVAGLRILNFSRVSPNFMGLTSLGIKIGILCDFLYSVLLFNAILGLYFLELALSRPQVRRARSRRRQSARECVGVRSAGRPDRLR
jgi:hypothetical protein